jgi:hypothetical protein
LNPAFPVPLQGSCGPEKGRARVLAHRGRCLYHTITEKKRPPLSPPGQESRRLYVVGGGGSLGGWGWWGGGGELVGGGGGGRGGGTINPHRAKGLFCAAGYSCPPPDLIWTSRYPHSNKRASRPTKTTPKLLARQNCRSKCDAIPGRPTLSAKEKPRRPVR